MNTIDYFTPDELTNLRGQTGGINAASPQSSLASDINSEYLRKKAALAASRAGTPSINTSVSAPASVPVGGTVSPVATAEAASNPSIGQRIISAKSAATKGLGYAARGLSATQAAKGVYDAATGGINSGAVDNIFQGVAGILSPGAGLVGNALSAARDAALSRVIPGSIGPNNVGPELQKQIDAAGGLDNLAAQQRAQQAQPTEQYPTSHEEAQPTPPPALTAIPAGVPASGTGYFKNETTGKVQAVGNPNQPTRDRIQYRQEPSPTPAPGGVFSTLLGPMVDQARATGLGAALDTREYKRQHAQQAQDIEAAYKSGELENQARAAGAHELTSLAQYKTATTKESPTKILQDALGNPIQVDQQAGTARKIPVQETPTLEDFIKKARAVPGNKGRSDSELATYYQNKYGG